MPRITLVTVGWVVVLLAGISTAHAQETPPLGRYVPLEELSLLIENNGLASKPKAWKATAAYKMLNETSLGVMLEEVAAQLIERALRDAPNPRPTGKELVGLLEHLIGEGFVIGFCGSLDPPQPKALVVVIRNAAKNPVFKKTIAIIPPLNEPAAQKVDAPGGRTVWQTDGPPIRWWYEKDDAVFSLSPPGEADRVIPVLEGKADSALKSPIRTALMKPSEAGDLPISLIFVNLDAFPPLPPRAAELGLDAITRIEARMSILDKGIVSTLGIVAPRPRRGLLALFDQPPIGMKTRLTVPAGVTESALVSVDLAKTADTIFGMLKEHDPDSAARLQQVAEKFQNKTGLSLQRDLIAKLGPRIAVVLPEGGGLGNIFGLWFTPPELSLVAEVKDVRDFAKTLDHLMVEVNRELKAAGAMVPAQRGQPSPPGTSYAEFRKLSDPERGYILAVPPAVLPTPAGLRPTVIVDTSRGLVAFGTSPATARKVLGALVIDGGPIGAPRDPAAVALAESDQSQSLPAILTNIPSLVQFMGYAASQPNPGQPRPVGSPFRLLLDPDVIPTAESLRPFLFPSRYTMTSDASAIRFSAYQAFPITIPEIKGGIEAPVLIALLLPAVQAAREAARRAQCVNNLKQMGLAFHNYETTNGGLPAQAIVDKNGKPLLSWRVAILPLLDQQELFNKFKLDEPWDSPNNKPLIAEMPNVYVCPSNPPGVPGTTTYKVFIGEGTLLKPDKPTQIAEITDGTSNTLMVVESGTSVPWTKPEDLPFAAAVPPQPVRASGAFSRHPGGFNALFADGSVRFLKSTISAHVFQALITRAGGEVVRAGSF